MMRKPNKQSFTAHIKGKVKTKHEAEHFKIVQYLGPRRLWIIAHFRKRQNRYHISCKTQIVNINKITVDWKTYMKYKGYPSSSNNKKKMHLK